ncbi:hypothetical protein [Agromyces mangrovi Wang et al. 2018]|uniref:hypothetical protein n=1 Tax=Agromyces mangrovi TaxID=1858653 RepID=UPI0025734482|nr:hypothetical protein [Agromyces mangrovi]BDZ65752.1 hypothetical protein GCM10025877_26900 [Agromyces mangrovi]
MPPTSRLPAELAATALAVAAAGWVAQVFTPAPPDSLAVALTVLFWWVVPTLTVCAFVTALAAGGLLGGLRAIAVAVVGSVGYVCATLAAIGFSQGIDAADAGLPDPPLTRIIVPLVAFGWLLGALAIGILLDGVGRERMPRTGVRIGISALVGIVLAPSRDSPARTRRSRSSRRPPSCSWRPSGTPSTAAAPRQAPCPSGRGSRWRSSPGRAWSAEPPASSSPSRAPWCRAGSTGRARWRSASRSRAWLPCRSSSRC